MNALDQVYQRAGFPDANGEAEGLTLEQVRYHATMQAVEETGSAAQAARQLGINRTTVAAILARRGMSLVHVLLLVGLLAGCSTNRTQTTKSTHEIQSHQVPLPPLPRAARASTWSEANHVARTVAPPAGPKPLRLEWDKNHLRPETVTEIWASTNMIDWAKVGEVSEPSFDFLATEKQQFFIVRNRLGEQVSEWNK